MVNITVSNAKVSGKLFIVKLYPSKIDYGQYLVVGELFVFINSLDENTF